MGYKLLLKGIRHYGYYPVGRRVSHRQAQVLMMDEVAKLLDLPKNSLVLDAGCGEGDTALHLTQKYGLEVVGVDLVEESIKIARKKARSVDARDTRVKFRVENFTKLSYKTHTFDGIYALETLTHAKHPSEVLAHWYKLLKPGGKLVIIDYEVIPLYKIPKDPLRKYLKIVAKETNSPGVLTFYPGYLKEHLANLGYTKHQIKRYNATSDTHVSSFLSTSMVAISD